MTRYHINPETLRPNKCDAKIQCKWAGSPHYDSKDAARKDVENTMRGEEVPTPVSRSENASEASLNAAVTALQEAGVSAPQTQNLVGVSYLTKKEMIMAQELTEMAESSKNGKISDGLLSKASGYHFAKELLTGKERLMLQDMEILTNRQSEAEERARAAYKKVLVVPTKIELDEEFHGVEPEFYGYGVAELLADRGFDHPEIAAMEQRGFHSVTLKVPGYYEVAISTDLARRELGMPTRTPTAKDASPLRQAEITMLEARRNSTGMFESQAAAKAAENAYREASKEFRRLKKEARND